MVFPTLTCNNFAEVIDVWRKAIKTMNSSLWKNGFNNGSKQTPTFRMQKNLQLQMSASFFV